MRRQCEGRDALGQLKKGQGAQYHSNLLYSAANQLLQFFLVLRRYLNTQGWTSHAFSMCQNICLKLLYSLRFVPHCLLSVLDRSVLSLYGLYGQVW